jgi:hypothetical protein
MSLAITMNLIAVAVVVGGWAVAVRAVYKRLSDPYARTGARPRPGAAPAPAPGASSRPEPVLTGRHAA